MAPLYVCTCTYMHIVATCTRAHHRGCYNKFTQLHIMQYQHMIIIWIKSKQKLQALWNWLPWFLATMTTRFTDIIIYIGSIYIQIVSYAWDRGGHHIDHNMTTK